MNHATAQWPSTWAEDRAPVRTDPSADPGAETEGRAASPPPAFSRLRDQQQSAKPSRHEAAKSPTRCPSQPANANRQKFQFPLNQDMSTVGDSSNVHLGLRRSHFTLRANTLQSQG